MLYGFDKKIGEFKTLAKNNRLSQSYIFYGDPQIGKAAFARQLAVFLETGEFVAATKILTDFLEIEPEPDKEAIGIEAANSVREFLFQKPFISSRRTVIVPEAERLTDEAQAALLKIVEEPPRESLIILILPNPEFLTAALVSRCQKIYFPRLSWKELETFLVRDFKIEPAAAKKAAIASFGRLGRALALIGYNDTKVSGPGDYFEKKIIAGWEKMAAGAGSGKMAWLLAREAAIGRLNLNVGLQQRAAEEFFNG